jgi:acyl carrier protein
MGDLRENWDPEQFKHEIKQIVSRISRIDEAELQDHLFIREELGIDSLMGMEIIATCEKHLKLKINETVFADIQTVGDFLELLLSIWKGTSA